MLTGKTCEFVKVDLLDHAGLRELFKTKGPFQAVIHFAALKSVGESTSIPLKYYKNNLSGSITLLEVRSTNIICERCLAKKTYLHLLIFFCSKHFL